MSVYVGALFDTRGQIWKGSRWRYQFACHMWADTAQELHDLAQRIGLRRGWFQEHPRLPHYDLTAKRREAAIKAGAVQGSEKDYFRRLRSGGGGPSK